VSWDSDALRKPSHVSYINVVGNFLMRGIIYILLIVCLNSCNKSSTSQDKELTSDTTQTSIDTILTTTSPISEKLSIIVLPPYDEIANAGISPDIQDYLETEISKDSSVTLIKFPYKDLMNVPYHHVYDKKYCKPITDKVDADILVMTKLDLKERTGNMNSDQWTFKIRIYDVKNDRQKDSEITGANMSDSRIKEFLKSKRQELIEEIKNYPQQSL
jgi:hypothetical protein